MTPTEITALAERLGEVRGQLKRGPGLAQTCDRVSTVADEAATAPRALAAKLEGRGDG